MNESTSKSIISFEAPALDESTKKKKKEGSSLNINQASGDSSGDSGELQNKISAKLLNKIQLSSKSRNLLIIRIVLLCLTCIFIPMETILNTKLEKLETTYFFTFLNRILGLNLVNNSPFYYTSYIVLKILSDKDTIATYICILYVLIHPFLAIKLVLVTHLAYYVITILNCLYQSKRPFWFFKENNRFCHSDYANPSTNFFLSAFFLIYALTSLNFLKKRKKKTTWEIKFLLFLTYIPLNLLTFFIFLVNRLNFIYQIVFTLCITLVILCCLIDFENSIHNVILKSMKNIFKARKYKIKVFFYVLGMTVSAIVIYFFIVQENLNAVEEILAQNSNCRKSQKEELGLQRSFMEIPYVFGMIGAFWGASFTLERDCGRWWGTSSLKMVIKLVILAVVIVGYLTGFHFIPHITYEFDFVLYCIKYFCIYYIVMGLLPLLFSALGLNERVRGVKKKTSLFTTTIFADTGEFTVLDRVEDKNLHMDNVKNSLVSDIIEEDDNEGNHSDEELEKKDFNKSFIGDVQKQKEDDKFEFTMDVRDDYINEG